MSSAISPQHSAFARQVLASEAAVAAREGERGPVASRVCEKLRRPLGTLAGAAGFRALLSRSLHLASAEIAWLETVGVQEDGTLHGLSEAEAGLSESEIATGETVLVARLLALLMTFIGESLTRHVLQDVWPEGDIAN